MGEGYKMADSDEIMCGGCKEALRYDRDNRQWRTKYIDEDEKAYRRCYNVRYNRWDHSPVGNVGRLVRAAKVYNDKKALGNGRTNHGTE